MSSPVAETSLAFSICIACYNGRKYLPALLESIRAQTHDQWELVVAEDGSPEPSRDLVESFAATVPQTVTYVESPTNLGTPYARDLAINNSSLPFIAISDADDLWHPTHLASLAACLAAPDTHFAFSGFAAFNTDPHHPSQTYQPGPEYVNDLRTAYFYQNYWIQPSTCAFRRDLLSRTGRWSKNMEHLPAWFPNHRIAEDRNFFMRVIHAGIQPVWTGGVTVSYRKHADSVTEQDTSGTIYRIWFYNYYGLLKGIPRGPQRKFLAHLNNSTGRSLLQRSPYRAAAFYFRAWRWYPMRMDRLLRAVNAGCRALLQKSAKS
jgi:glycosyltransferase involved in cell wall biosynthesis